MVHLVYGMVVFDFMPHVVDFPSWRKRAEGALSFDDGYAGMRILTVGRVDYQKGIDLAIEAARILQREGLSFRWYVIGHGFDYARKCEDLVSAYGLEDQFVFLDSRENPLPYFQQCDVYVQPSRWEAYCLTVAEARAFAKPIVASDFVGIREQIEDGVSGFIVPVGDVEVLAAQIKVLVNDVDMRSRFSSKLALSSDGNVDYVRKCWDDFLQLK